MPQRNTPERRDMLAARAVGQRRRTAGFQPMARKPAGHIGKWDPAWQFFVPRDDLRIVPAWMNRRTGEPHERKCERWLA